MPITAHLVFLVVALVAFFLVLFKVREPIGSWLAWGFIAFVLGHIF